MDVLCCGVIPIKREESQIKVLLVKHRKGHWAFPKGHTEYGETPEQTAQRELTEETGLTIASFLPFKPLNETYSYVENGEEIHKKVIYFLCHVTGSLSLMEVELESAEWMTVEEAEKKVTFKEARLVCQQLKDLLSRTQAF